MACACRREYARALRHGRDMLHGNGPFAYAAITCPRGQSTRVAPAVPLGPLRHYIRILGRCEQVDAAHAAGAGALGVAVAIAVWCRAHTRLALLDGEQLLRASRPC